MALGEEDVWAFEERDEEGATVDDSAAEEEAALVPGEDDTAARDDEGADEELSCVADGCAEEEGEGEENAWEDAWVAAESEGMGIDSDTGRGVVALAWLSARRW